MLLDIDLDILNISHKTSHKYGQFFPVTCLGLIFPHHTSFWVQNKKVNKKLERSDSCYAYYYHPIPSAIYYSFHRKCVIHILSEIVNISGYGFLMSVR
jgi:hypothetical protein